MPFEIPASWEWVRLGELYNAVSAKRVLQADWKQEGVPFYRAREIVKLSQFGFVDNDLFITEEHYQSLKTAYGIPLPNDIILSAVGTIGKTYIVRKSDKFYYKDASVLCLQNLFKLNSQYIQIALNSPVVQDQMHEQSKGTTVDTITIEKVGNYILPLPPLVEQKRIVAELERWFALIDEIEQNKVDLQEAIKTTKSKVLDLAIHGKLVPQDPNDEPAIELLKRINPSFKPCDTSHYENLPETWCVAHMSEVYNHTTGKALKKADMTGELRQYITTSNVYWNSFDFTEVRSMYFTEKELDKCTAHKGDLLVCNGGDVGRAAIWDYDYDICYQNHISRLRPKSADIVFNPFYSYLFRYFKDKGQLNGKGVAITSLSAADIQSLAIPLPPLTEQKRIVERIETIFAQLDMITAEL